MKALVTGGARRIGRAVALALAREGVDVAVHYSSSEREAHELCAELEALHVRAVAVKADLADGGELASLVERAAAAVGRLDILVNNASIFPPDTLQSMTLASLQENMAVNAWAPLVLCRAFRRQTMRGRIVNLLDSRITGYDWSHVAYMLSKQAFSYLTRMMALELAPDITVNAVAPGLILPPPGQDESYLIRMKERVPLKKWGSAEEVADAAVFLLGCEFITGEIIYVDGGRHLKEFTEPADGSDPH